MTKNPEQLIYLFKSFLSFIWGAMNPFLYLHAVFLKKMYVWSKRLICVHCAVQYKQWKKSKCCTLYCGNRNKLVTTINATKKENWEKFTYIFNWFLETTICESNIYGGVGKFRPTLQILTGYIILFSFGQFTGKEILLRYPMKTINLYR